MRPPSNFDRLILLAFLLTVHSATSGQTVRPVIVEYRAAARGKFELINNSLDPLSVVLQPCSFSVREDGTGVFQPLDSEIHLKLSAMSFRIPPQQAHWVFYEATADKLPAWFAIYSTMAGRPNPNGISMQIDLPHTVYMLQRERLERDDVVIESTEYDLSKHRIVVTVSNTSQKLGRVLEWQVAAKGKKVSQNGFPLLPKARRRLEVDWKSPNSPERVSLQFDHFTLKQEISVSRQ